MCLYLYGSLYGDVPENEYEEIRKKYDIKIALGTKHDVKEVVRGSEKYNWEEFRITNGICDCDSAVGRHDASDKEITELRDLILELSALPGAKQINICKTEEGRQNKKEVRLKLKHVDVASFLAEMHNNYFYSIEL